jgi:hypothetical protein
LVAATIKPGSQIQIMSHAGTGAADALAHQRYRRLMAQIKIRRRFIEQQDGAR